MCILLLNIFASWLYQWTEPEMHRSVSLHTYIDTYSNIQDCLLKEISFEDHQENLETQIRGGGRRDLFLSILKRQWHPTPVLCLENPRDGGAWWAIVHGVAKSQTWLSDFTFTFHFHALEKEMAVHSSVLAWRESQGWRSLVGCCLWGRTELDMTEAT